jgi:hypothetical protein
LAYRRRRNRNRARDTGSATAGARVTASSPPADTREPLVDDKVPAGQSDLPPQVEDAADLQAVHKEAVDRYETAWEKDRRNQLDAYDDLRFISEEESQWDPIALRARKDEQRPILTVNKCPQFVRQVTGDIRQLRPSIHVVPIDERANDMISTEVLPEMMRYIERRSDAKAAYYSAADQMVAAGIGHVRIFTEYAAATTMNQEIGIGLIQDGIAVVWDADSVNQTRKDANYCFVPIDMARKAAQDRWSDKAFDSPLPQQSNHEAWSGWFTDDSVRVTEYWRKAPCEREVAIYPDGRIIDLTDDDYVDVASEGLTYQTDESDTEYGPDEGERKISKDEANYRDADSEDHCGICSMFRSPNGCVLVKGQILPEMVCDHFDPALIPGGLTGQAAGGMLSPLPLRPQLGPGMGPKRADAIAAGASIETRDSYRVERYVMSASEILDGPEYWSGMEIPIVPFLGEEIKIGRMIVRRGVVRPLKDVQRLYNYAISADAEAVALQPKAPFKGTRKNFEKNLDQWETANTRNWAYLEYEPDPLNGGRPPEREPPPVASSGIKELLTVASSDMNAVTGIYPSGLGAPAQETSGRAIVARQREGDTGTFLYVEAFGRAIERVGQIIIDLIPHIYDTKRSLRVVGDDGRMSKIDINTPIIDPNGDGIDTITMNDVTIGSYQVSVEMGPSFSTRREEAREGMKTLMQSLGPQAAPLFADLFVQGQDFPMADRIAERLRLLLPPQIQQMEAAKSGQPAPPPPPQQPPNPEMQLRAAELQLKQNELDAKVAIENQSFEVEMQKIGASLQQARLAADSTMLAHATKASGQRLDYVSDQQGRAHDVRMGLMNGAAAAAPPPSDEQQQQQINALIEAVTQLQQAVGQIAQVAMAGVPRPPAPPPGPPGPPPPVVPPPTPPPAPPSGP